MMRGTTIPILLALAAASAVAAPDKGAAPAGDDLRLLWDNPQFQREFMGSFGTNSEVEPSLSSIERERMQRVLELLASHDVPGAKAELRAMIEPPPPRKKRSSSADGSQSPNALYYFTLANLEFQDGELEDARGHYEAAITAFPAFRRAYKNLGLIHVRLGEYSEAVQALSRVVELGGGDGLTYGLLGYAYLSGEQFLSAESAFRNALLLQRDQRNWKIGLAQALVKQRRFAEAVTLAGELIEADPQQSELWLLQANAYIGMEQPLEAAKNYEILDRMGLATVPALNTLGDIYVNERAWDLAARAYAAAVRLDPGQDPERPIRSVENLALRGAWAQARELLAEVQATFGTRLDETEAKRLLKLEARMTMAQGGGAEAVEVLERIVALDPLDGDALILLGQHYAGEDAIEKAIFYFERAEGLAAFEADARLRHAQVLVGEGRYREALPLLKRSQELAPREDVERYLAQVERIARTAP